MTTWLAGIVGISVVSAGCADDGATDDQSVAADTTGSTTMSSSDVTGGTPSSTDQPAVGALTPGAGSPTVDSTGSASESPTGTAADSGSGGTQGLGAGGAGGGGAGAGGAEMGGLGAGGSGGGGDDIGDDDPGPDSMTDDSMTDDSMTDDSMTDDSMTDDSMTDDSMTDEPAEEFMGTCTASTDTGRNASGTGPHDVVIETNSEDGIRCGTIYRPADLDGDEAYPIFVWGEGGCSQNGLSNQAAMAEIASWGYFIVADGTPGGENSCQGGQSGDAFLDYITWAIAENDKPCSAYYQSLDTTKIAADGFSCGGLMAENVAGDPRFTAIGITSSGLMGPNNSLWDSMHAPFKIMNGGSSDIAYENGLNDYEAIASRGIPILYFAKSSAGHGGDLNNGRGDFNLVNLAWLNWQLKGDEGATGKAFLIGPSCEFCNDGGWEFMSANIE